MNKKYCIWVVSPAGYTHSHAFDEIALGLQSAFRELGYDAPIVHSPRDISGCPVVLGWNLIPHLGSLTVPEGTVLYNLEQIQTPSPWMTQRYIDLLRSYPVWDYSGKNIEALSRMGVKKVKFCGIGYAPELTRIKPLPCDIDVLLYGSLNDRRCDILNGLIDLGFKVEALFDIYGEARDRYIARSRIVLNIHYYEAKVFEIVRISYLLANGRFVVSEEGADPELERSFQGGVAFAGYYDLVDACLRYSKEDKSREEISACGFSSMKSISQAALLEEALRG